MNKLFKEIDEALQHEGEWKGTVNGHLVEIEMQYDISEYSELTIDGVYVGDLYNFIELQEILESI